MIQFFNIFSIHYCKGPFCKYKSTYKNPALTWESSLIFKVSKPWPSASTTEIKEKTE